MALFILRPKDVENIIQDLILIVRLYFPIFTFDFIYKYVFLFDFKFKQDIFSEFLKFFKKE